MRAAPRIIGALGAAAAAFGGTGTALGLGGTGPAPSFDRWATVTYSYSADRPGTTIHYIHVSARSTVVVRSRPLPSKPQEFEQRYFCLDPRERARLRDLLDRLVAAGRPRQGLAKRGLADETLYLKWNGTQTSYHTGKRGRWPFSKKPIRPEARAAMDELARLARSPSNRARSKRLRDKDERGGWTILCRSKLAGSS